jgi:hypothetical protein
MKYGKRSLKYIRAGKKFLTSRTTKTEPSEEHPEIIAVFGPLPLWFIKHFLYAAHGVGSLDEYHRWVNQIFRRKVDVNRELYVHVVSPMIVMEMNPE